MPAHPQSESTNCYQVLILFSEICLVIWNKVLGYLPLAISAALRFRSGCGKYSHIT